MAGGHTHVLGLDIGSWAIKLVELELTGAGIELRAQPLVVPTPPRTVEDGVIVDMEAVAGVLRDAVSTGRFGTRDCIASVGGTSSAVVRVTEVPRMSGKELDEAIEWELDRQAPFPVENAFYDYTPVEPPDAPQDSENMEVMLAVAQEDMIDVHVDTITKGKLAIQALDIEPLAIVRALVEVAEDGYSDETVCIVHIGASSSMIIAVQRGLPNFVRPIPTAGNQLTDAISQNLLDDPEQAQSTKHALATLSEDIFADEEEYEVAEGGQNPAGGEETAVASAPEGESQAGAAEEMDPAEMEARQVIYEAIVTPLIDLVDELDRSMNFYQRQHPDSVIDRILLSGGTALLPGVEDFIAAETEIQTQLADPFQHLITDEAIHSPQYLQQIGPTMVIAVGLALRDMVGES